MNPRKLRQLIILNAAIALLNVVLFSKALVGLSLLAGTAISISAAWTAVFISAAAFIKGNTAILNAPQARLLLQSINSLESCLPVFEDALHRGDVFDENVLKNIEQIKRFRRKHETIKDILLQKFSQGELSYQKFSGVLQEVENVLYLNMRSILNKISAFDIDEYEAMERKGALNAFSQEKLDIYKEYIDFVNSATETNEDILLKLDKMLLEISRYNSIDGGDIQKLPAMVEMDELIRNAKLYK